MNQHIELTSEKRKEALKKLAEKLGIDSATRGWRTKLQIKLNLSKLSIISTWIARGFPKEIENYFKEIGVNVKVWNEIIDNIITDGSEPYQEEKSIRNIREKSYPTAIDTSMRNQAVNDILEIFDSGDPVLIPAIQANLIAFRRALERERQFNEIREENKQIRTENDKLNERVKNLEDEVKQLAKSIKSDQIRKEDLPEERVDIIKRRAM